MKNSEMVKNSMPPEDIIVFSIGHQKNGPQVNECKEVFTRQKRRHSTLFYNSMLVSSQLGLPCPILIGKYKKHIILWLSFQNLLSTSVSIPHRISGTICCLYTFCHTKATIFY
ncbi:hypothetical protein TNCT_56641 [Trichonephila clavata]|uniref:Uncharacterized protein n=1 Tax=Trichonephila clavata TaxID=2740835 RepID=A0A8X6G6C1_TRICU|nr:hypothetical protein TNCT_56641 [Trichonephila clavata]